MCHQSGRVSVDQALTQAGFDYEMFHQRGGIYKWNRDRSKEEQS